MNTECSLKNEKTEGLKNKSVFRFLRSSVLRLFHSSVIQFIRSYVFQSSLDLVYPPYCLRCHNAIKPLTHSAQREFNLYLCPECLGQITPINESNVCLKCGMSLGPHSGKRDNCPSCNTMHFLFSGTSAYGEYKDALKDIILLYKYGKQKLLAETLAKCLAERLEKEKEILGKIDIIVPVPLTKAKEKQRGFNQCELIAGYLGRHFGKPVSKGSLVRIKETPAQASLSRAQRIENLKDAFKAMGAEEFKGKNILLVDDVMTTGATAGEVSRVLKHSNAKSIYVAVLAR
ncbi:MAG: ComF family protein [Planctomycetes bacterium]|nr:ComF family protein [Planctomycetota bacterium]